MEKEKFDYEKHTGFSKPVWGPEDLTKEVKYEKTTIST